MEQPTQPVEPKKTAEKTIATPTKNTNQTTTNNKGTLVLILAGAWILVGLIAFIYSLYCFSRSGTTGEKILGLLLSMLIGPFYFIYVYVSSSYCK